MKLYYAETLAPRKVCAFAKYVDAPVEYVHLDLHKGEHRRSDYLVINPNGKVPHLSGWKDEPLGSRCHPLLFGRGRRFLSVVSGWWRG